MPPGAKISREQIVNVGIEIVRSRGWSALTARKLTTSLGFSTQPIYRIFRDMKELKDDVFSAICTIYTQESRTNRSPENVVLNLGREAISFAQKEPNLFRTLFLNEDDQYSSRLLKAIFDSFWNGSFFDDIGEQTGLDSREDVELLIKALWFTAQGIASSLSMDENLLLPKEIERILRSVIDGVVTNLKEKT
jgi:AcrR family transcriptional regulator